MCLFCGYVCDFVYLSLICSATSLLVLIRVHMAFIRHQMCHLCISLYYIHIN